MRLYGKRFMRNTMRRSVDARAETRDGSVYDVLPEQRYCRVRVQGTDEFVVARYPLNWQSSPSWLRPGNAVRIAHVGGVRGKIEVVGHGLRVPTTSTGVTLPDPVTPPDSLISGGAVTASEPPSMDVNVASGVVRIGGALYGFNADTITVSAAPGANSYRYDLIEVGIDDTIDYTAGTPASLPTAPTKPAVTTGQILLAYILVGNGQTTIQNNNIGQLWVPPAIATIAVVVTDDDLDWTEASTTIVLTAKDQYGNTYVKPSGTYTFAIRFLSGNGTLNSADDGDSSTEVTQAHASTATVTYTRDQLSTDESPTFEGYIQNIDPTPVSWAAVIVRDSFGNQMPLWVDPYYFS